MKKNYIILSTLLSVATFTLAGCGTTSSVNTNANVANTNVGNTNTALSNSNVDTSDWQTYTNDEYGFSFKYPKDWELKKLDETNIGLISPELKTELAKGPNSASSSDLILVINQPITKALYITDNNMIKSLQFAETRNDIKELNFTDDNHARFIEHNDFADVDQYSQYIRISSDTLISATYSMNIKNISILEKVLSSLKSN